MPTPNEIPLSRPDITAREEELVLAVLRSGRLSIGPMVERFEQLVAHRSGCRFGIAVNSGTSGLHLVMSSLGIAQGHEVITTPFSFIASANCILFQRAIPKLVDIDPVSLNMDPLAVEAAINSRTKAIVGVATFGSLTHMDLYAKIADANGIALVEDCCEAMGATLGGQAAGSFGTAGVFGFYPNKQITTGEGGMVVTNDSGVAELCRSLRNQGRPIGTPPTSQTTSTTGSHMGSWLKHERLGYNYRLSEVNAAIGVGQMERLDAILAKRNSVAHMYHQRLADIGWLTSLRPQSSGTMSWFVYIVELAKEFSLAQRDAIIRSLREQNIGAADYFPCIHLQPFYSRQFGFRPGMFPVAESVAERTIALPFYNDLTESEVDRIVQALRRAGESVKTKRRAA